MNTPNDPKNPGDELADIVPIAAMTEWTDAQWAAHDARVAAERARLEPSRETEIARVPLESLGWPRRALHAAKTADVARPTIARMLSNDFAKSNIVVLSGPAGCGKTVAAARWAIDSGKIVRFVRASTFAASSRYDAELRSLWYDAEALVLDDLGAEYLDAKGSFLVDLDELIDTFYGDVRPLAITTNCMAARFEERYGERVQDRLRECAAWFSVSGESMRRKP